jgi:hypothetical protein
MAHFSGDRRRNFPKKKQGENRKRKKEEKRKLGPVKRRKWCRLYRKRREINIGRFKGEEGGKHE